MNKPAQELWFPDWKTIPDESVHHLLREAKEQLQGTIDLGISSDQRSAALGGVFGAATFASFTVAATLFAGAPAFILAGLLFAIASGCCFTASFPGDFFLNGYEPRLLALAASDILWMERYTIEDIQRRIEGNKAEIAREAALIAGGIRFALAGLAVSVTYFLIRALRDVSHFGQGQSSAWAMAGVAGLVIFLVCGAYIEANRA